MVLETRIGRDGTSVHAQVGELAPINPAHFIGGP